MRRDLHFERVYPYPPERVWRALTDPRSMATWLMENDFQPVVGHRFHFRTQPAPGFDGVVNCEVLEVDAPRRLVYAWAGGPIKKPTQVAWTLEPVPEGTRLRLDHTGFEGLGAVIVSVVLGAGWRGILRQELASAVAAAAYG